MVKLNLIPISQSESFYVRKTYPDVCIVVVNKEHPSRAKKYVMTVEKKALYLIMNTNISARRELLQILESEILGLANVVRKDRASIVQKERYKALKQEIQEINELGV